MPTKGNERFVTRREAAELAGVHINTVRIWETTGRVEVHKGENGIVLIPRSQVEAVIETRRDLALEDKAKIAALEAELRVTKDEPSYIR